MRFGTFARLGLLMSAMIVTPISAIAKDTPEEEAQRRTLNEQQARMAAQQVADYQEKRQAIADADAAAQRSYREAVAAHDAEVAAIKQKAAEDQARWEAAVAACEAGDYSQCAQPGDTAPR